MATLTAERGAALPAIDARAITTLIVAGALATVAFDFFGQALSPLLSFIPTVGAKLAPVPLANGVLAVIGNGLGLGGAEGVSGRDVSSLGLGHFMHVITGLLLYPIGYAFVARPISLAVAPAVPGWVVGAVYGVALWVFALYFMAHLVAGNPPFLGWGGITYVALYGHVIFGVVVALIWSHRHER